MSRRLTLISLALCAFIGSAAAQDKAADKAADKPADATPPAATQAAAKASDAPSTVYRCEGVNGRITYSNEPCPSGTKSSRRLEDSPAVAAGASKDAGRDARSAGSIEASRSGNATRVSGLPQQQIEQLDQERASQRTRCQNLDRRVQYARQDLQAALPSQRASAELALRRAQDEYQSACPRR